MLIVILSLIMYIPYPAVYMKIFFQAVIFDPSEILITTVMMMPEWFLEGQNDIHYFYLIFGNEFELIYLCQYPITYAGYNGANIYGIGDVNNDGFDDFMLGYGVAPEQTYHNYLYFGDTIIDSVADLVIDNVPFLSTAGGLPCGDWDGDNTDDFVGYCCYDQGVCVWLGDETGNLQPGTFVEYFSSLGTLKNMITET